ncbi:hypothetical protein RN22_01425 [Grimontia sp. AD028]|uniref:hypothetical protein n=1 Tax=Grimontia sp. AD028 TaxID=1581149 RepID=UPI00061A9771|nr:hypothetical protein [Grimontia sp. AD028]KKD62294.1 hypothetical protein RN22_01425 [Grimontia sp. AD028]
MSGENVIQLKKKRYISFILDELVKCFPSISNHVMAINESRVMDSLMLAKNHIKVSVGNNLRFEFDDVMVKELMRHYYGSEYQPSHLDLEEAFLNKKVNHWIDELGLDLSFFSDEEPMLRKVSFLTREGELSVFMSEHFIKVINEKLGLNISKRVSVKNIYERVNSQPVEMNLKINNINSTIGVLKSIEPGVRIKTQQKIEDGLLIVHGDSVLSKNAFVTFEQGQPQVTIGSIESDYRSGK